MLAAVRAAVPTERDHYWSAQAGLEVLNGTPLARSDTWSWSAEGMWYPNSPAWNVVLGLGWQSLGFWGLFLVAFLSMSALFGVALLGARLAGARALPTLLVFIPILLGASASLSARATVVVQAFVLAAAIFAWWWGGIANRLNSVAAIAVVGAVGFGVSFAGNWVHLSFMLMAAAIAVMWAVAWWLSPGLNALRRIALTLAGTTGLFLGCILSPYGVELTLERSRVVSEICQGIIIEWTSVFRAAEFGDFRWIPVAVVAACIALGSGMWAFRSLRRHGRSDARIRLLVPLAIFAVPMTLIGFGALRFLGIGMLAILPVAAAATTALVDVVHERQGAGGILARPKLVEYASGRFWVTVMTGIAIVLAPLAAFGASKGSKTPEAVLGELLPRDCSLFSDAGAAGPVILTRPDVKVWIDGRADFYGRQHLIESVRIFSAIDPVPEEADCVLLPLWDGLGHVIPLALSLDRDPVWDRIATLDGYALWVRP